MAVAANDERTFYVCCTIGTTCTAVRGATYGYMRTYVCANGMSAVVYEVKSNHDKRQNRSKINDG